MTTSLVLRDLSDSTGIPLPLNLNNALEGPVIAGGVEGGRSSGLVSSRSPSLSEHSEGVGASVVEDDGQDLPEVVGKG